MIWNPSFEGTLCLAAVISPEHHRDWYSMQREVTNGACRHTWNY
jgi:hypothetical protein